MKTFVLAIVAGVVLAAGVVHAEDADISAAQAKLEEVKSALKGAGGGFGGHREKAVQHIDRALDELKQAQHADTKKDTKTEHQVNKLEKKDERLQKRIDTMKQKTTN